MARRSAIEVAVQVEYSEKGLLYDPDHRGNPRWYFRRKGFPKVRLREPFGSPQFREELRCARLGLPYRTPEPEAAQQGPVALPGTLKWLCLEYLRRGCVSLGKATVERKDWALASMCDTPLEGKQQLYGRTPVRFFIDSDVEYLRDLKKDFPEAANYRVKTLRAMFAWAMKRKDAAGAPLASSNPAAGVDKYKVATDGFHTWTIDEIRQYFKTHEPGSKADLAGRLFLFTGLRISDVAPLGRQHRYKATVPDAAGEPVTQHRLRRKAKKTSTSSGVDIDIPLLPPLVEALDLVPTVQLTFLQTEQGRPFTEKGLGNKMRDWCDAAKLPHCSAHGLRKALSTFMAEDEATGAQLMSIFGWTTLRQADRYTKAAERKRMATAGFSHLRKII